MKRLLIHTLPLIAAFAATLATPLTAQGVVPIEKDGPTSLLDLRGQVPAHVAEAIENGWASNSWSFSSRERVFIGPYGEKIEIIQMWDVHDCPTDPCAVYQDPLTSRLIQIQPDDL